MPERGPEPSALWIYPPSDTISFLGRAKVSLRFERREESVLRNCDFIVLCPGCILVQS